MTISQYLNWALNAFIATILIATLASQFSDNNQICDIASQGIQLYLVGATLATIIALGQRRWKIACVAGLLALTNSLSLLTSPERHLPAKPTPNSTTLKILEANIDADKNKNYETLLKLIKDEAPDLIGIIELNPDWTALLDEKLSQYPYHLKQEQLGGIALYSKYPLIHPLPLTTGGAPRPRLRTTMQINNRSVTVSLAHVATPHKASAALRREEFKQLAIDCALDKNVILLGDLNCCPWTNYFKHLMQNGKLVDRANFGECLSTWPSQFPIFPIDHILSSQDFDITSRKVGPNIGSDHLPLIITLNIRSITH